MSAEVSYRESAKPDEKPSLGELTDAEMALWDAIVVAILGTEAHTAAVAMVEADRMLKERRKRFGKR